MRAEEAMKTDIRSWVTGLLAVGAVTSLLGCGVAQEEPKDDITVTPPVAAPVAPAAKSTPRVKGSTIIIIETEPPPGLQAPAKPVSCWHDDAELLCELVDGQCCSYQSDHTLVGCGDCGSM
jgi:hypothetical protein